MRDETLDSTALPSTIPADAYTSDLERLQRVGPVGDGDDAWLILAHALGRFCGLPAEQLHAAAASAADMLAVTAMAGGLSNQSPVLSAARALRALNEPVTFALSDRADPVTELVLATQAVAEEQEIAGLFGLAYAMLSCLLEGFGDRVAPRMQGRVLAQMGRSTRQLGAADLARELYDETMRVGHACNAFDVVARGHLGHGSMALTRGNYPVAREQFDAALMWAERANDPDLIRSSHHGLLNCGFTSGDLDAAMVHGWNVLRLSVAPEARAEALMNLAEICRLTGEHDAAMRTYAVVMEWTSHSRVHLHALSGALQAAVACERPADVQRFLTELEALLPTWPDVYMRANIGVELADSLHRLGEHALGSARLQDALVLARTHGFHEVVHRAEQAASVWHITTSPVEVVTRSSETRRKRPQRSEHFRSVLRSLNGLTAAAL